MPNLTPHFTSEELTRGSAGGTVEQRANLVRLAVLLENFRLVLGVPLHITSGLRDPARNAAVAGSETSQHLDGTAADFSPSGLTLQEAARRIDDAERSGRLATFGQLIYYPYTTGHIHVSLATRHSRNEKLVKLGGESGGYAKFSLGTFPRWNERCKGGACH